jgi:hypothetical protein
MIIQNTNKSLSQKDPMGMTMCIGHLMRVHQSYKSFNSVVDFYLKTPQTMRSTSYL